MTASPGWEWREPTDSSDVHVVPIDDYISHFPHECLCVPALEAVVRTDGSVGWVYTHHSLDGRETREPDWRHRPR